MNMKTTKRILSLVLTLMLVCALSVTVLAVQGTGTLQVTGNANGDTLGGKSVTIVPMFTEVGASDVEYELESAWEDFFADLLSTTTADPDLSDKAYDYVLHLGTDSPSQTAAEKMAAFAKDAKDYYYANTSDFTSVAQTAVANASTNTATFANLDAGSYLVIPAGSIDEVRGTDAMIVNVEAGETTTVSVKGVYPTVTKEVETKTAGTYSDDTCAGIGDVVHFKLTSEVPDMSEYTTGYIFNFVDTMSAGLTYVADSVEVTIGTQTDEDLASSYTVTWSGQVLTVGFANLKAVTGIAAGDTITVTYDAIINENAVIASTGNTNSAKVVYSNHPGTNETGESNPDITTVYTYDLVIDKYTVENSVEKKLSGAVFEISTTSGGTAIALVAEAAADTYRVAVAGDTSTITQMITSSTGLLTINGLDEGTYYIREVTPPNGYNGIASPIPVVIEKEGTSVNYTVDSTDQDTNHTVRVLNSLGVILPTTGGIGTILFTLVGVGVIVAGVMITSRKKKEEK